VLCVVGVSCFLAWQHPRGRSALLSLLFQLRGQTGVIEYVDHDGSREQWRYLKGVREGIWKRWNKDGKLVNQCEYRNGDPWNGICRIRDMKEFYGEYKNGKPWNGAYSAFTGNTNGDCFIDGQEMSLEAYRQHCGVSSNVMLIGIQAWKTKQ